ncbi:MAG TPA: hypothetical protein VFU53_03540 [Burkholderiales bacterium]|nr:hypothetical protein [Burkholderiales bacterium]
MARKVTQGGETKKVRGQKGVDPETTANWPWTTGPTTRAQRIRRALIG